MAVLPGLHKKRLALTIRGAVQGVGFRPFVFRLAHELKLTGWVCNSPQGVFVEVEGAPGALEQFLLRLPVERPPQSFIQSLESTWLDAVRYEDFEIRPSLAGGSKTTLLLPDIATCSECVHEVFDPANRRYHYPFTNCTHCGPRFSIIQGLPYDRDNTSMKQFVMCSRCQAEYEDPGNRRFHAQPNACPECGPQLELWTPNGDRIARGESALLQMADALRAGKVAAVKGLGGFHLMTDATKDDSLKILRQAKHREEKPFALMFPSLAAVRVACEVSPMEERLITAPEAPIVLLRRRAGMEESFRGGRGVSSLVAPGNPYLGCLLPYTPLHHLLLSLLGFPLVATSGNLRDEPICIDEREALERLGEIAEVFLVHNRPIVRQVDDSLARIVLGRELVLRRSRGYAPLPVDLQSPARSQTCLLAVGGHLKNTIALGMGGEAFISQHIGDLETAPASQAFRQVIHDLEVLYEVRPSVIVSDRHPHYLSTRFAREQAENLASPSAALPLVQVQHHIAHIFSCMAENRLQPPVLGVSWDGTGYGLDGTVWGGEFFVIKKAWRERVAHLRHFRLPGGDQAVKEPRRSALGLLFELFGEALFERYDLTLLEAFAPSELGPLKTMLSRHLNSPSTSSAGRLFDAVAALIGLRQKARFEGQGAMDLEFALPPNPGVEFYEFGLATGMELGSRLLVLDWGPVIHRILQDIRESIEVSRIAARFHNGLVESVVAVAQRMGMERVLLSGGCFQNLYLIEHTVRRLREEGFQPYWHQRVPPNDGGLAFGQLAAAVWEMENLTARNSHAEPP